MLLNVSIGLLMLSTWLLMLCMYIWGCSCYVWGAHVVYIMGLLITVMYGVALEVEVAKEQVVEGGLFNIPRATIIIS